ncbi:MAG: hypothetical protein P4L61_04450 [Candidatus Pacebacteria bacterium]|nr:hypothetical protein [Candidatus Paceibacterota bacterium]
MFTFPSQLRSASFRFDNVHSLEFGVLMLIAAPAPLPPPPPPPPPEEPPPEPPVVAVEAGPVAVFPETYVEVEGIGMVGEIGGIDYYCNDGVWIVCDSYRLERFHGWERGHRDWREHSIHNDRFRGHGERNGRAEPGHSQPGHGDIKHDKPAKKEAPKKKKEEKK